ncbi:hypothetical protein [Mycobacterium sp. 1274761.0]|uniref:hypothetical protein n=1 Tax=Mycobacterium sp. 1274761.0 TaxID=1834077 RepID=UPI000800212D|nr:hypothetical protein [Mycobacterium sp. 1274761.0]OBK76297.1 hypothetical protein A5651_06740 [Mycobacterium sp. 1274761.0]
MTTTYDPTQYLSAPAGAVHVGEWRGDGADRGRPFEHAPIDIGDATLTIHGVQYARGTTGRSIMMRLDEAIQSRGDDLTVQDARRLAAMLLNLADTCEILDGAQR